MGQSLIAGRSLAILARDLVCFARQGLNSGSGPDAESRRPSERGPPFQASQSPRQSRVKVCDAGSKHRAKHRKRRAFAPASTLFGDCGRPGRDGGTPPVRHRSKSWSIQLKRARRPGSSPVWQVFAPSPASAAENTQHAKQNADRCGASRGDPGRRGKGQSRRGI